MSLTELIERTRRLPASKQQKVIEFFQARQRDGEVVHRLRPVGGLWEGLSVDLTAEDIDDARRAIWSDFPRENLL